MFTDYKNRWLVNLSHGCSFLIPVPGSQVLLKFRILRRFSSPSRNNSILVIWDLGEIVWGQSVLRINFSCLIAKSSRKKRWLVSLVVFFVYAPEITCLIFLFQSSRHYTWIKNDSIWHTVLSRWECEMRQNFVVETLYLLMNDLYLWTRIRLD